MAALGAQGVQQRIEIVDPVIDHERRGAGRIRLTLRRRDIPDGRAGARLSILADPAEGRPTPGLHVNAEVGLIPGAQGGRVFRLEKDTADAGDSFHVGPKGKRSSLKSTPDSLTHLK